MLHRAGILRRTASPSPTSGIGQTFVTFDPCETTARKYQDVVTSELPLTPSDTFKRNSATHNVTYIIITVQAT